MATKIANNMDLWDYHAGPLFLRPMTDCYITLAWILKEPLDRARKFITYGLGQEKLEIERLKSTLEELDKEEQERMSICVSAKEAWVDSQHYAFLQHVDLGSWSGITTRKMAEDADCLDLYNFAYVGWSHAAHGTWNHIARYDSFPSEGPLHKHIWQPANLDMGAHMDVVINAIKYFDKLCMAIVEEFDLQMDLQPPNLWMANRVRQFLDEMKAAGLDNINLFP